MLIFVRKQITLVVLIAFYNLSSQQLTSHYPKFNWDKVPIAFHFGNSNRLMNAEEVSFVASHSNFVCLEKGHAEKTLLNTELGIEAEARQLKAINPEIKVIFYWNAFLDYRTYSAHEEYEEHKEWWLRKIDGTLDLKRNNIKRYDLSNPDFRFWWTEKAKKAVVSGSCDGVFMDAFPQVLSPKNKTLWGLEKFDSIKDGLHKIVREAREKIGDDKLIVYNGIRTTPSLSLGNDFKDFTDAVMIEHFGHFNSGTKECMLTDILEMQQAGKSGKIVVFKGWPGFAWNNKIMMKKSLAEKRKLARDNLEFPLAAFLVGAQENSYFVYNWGYRMDMGCLEWYSAFDKPLGKPLSDAVIDGWKLTREFEHLSVSVNLETKEAVLTEKL